MREELLKGLTEEQIKKVKECNSAEEVLALAKAEGVELTDEQLEAVSGGAGCSRGWSCPECGSTLVLKMIVPKKNFKQVVCFCVKCEHEWEETMDYSVDLPFPI
jgi:uncharacterized protein (UPF0212 family)